MKMDCPVCHGQKCMDVINRTEEIPYFGEIMESLLLCSSCGYRHTDVICLDQKEPVHYSLQTNVQRLNARVVKSQSATLTIPELGLKVEPGPKSLGYVSNIEGVLERFQTAVKTAMNLFDDETSQKNATIILEELDKVRSGEKSVEIILEDPFGQSFIAHPDASKRKLEEDEIKKLKTGFITIENDEYCE
ncbi:ZPR1 zinc finger domain-containing protein [Methanobacterium alcaliphilum]|uniref:ZPR1 zinc finger domain-containing protein n=1 Tax=Methanobacterium alcaliphilum TaxID=392018 RepID=UPI00318355D1